MGKVSWVGERGYGFITSEDGQDLFVSLSDLTDGSRLVVGASVDFERRAGPHGRVVAANVLTHQPLDRERTTGRTTRRT